MVKMTMFVVFFDLQHLSEGKWNVTFAGCHKTLIQVKNEHFMKY